MSEKPLSSRVVVALTLALTAVLAVALVVVANHRSTGVQGWDDPCATLPTDHPAPVVWTFRLPDGRVYSSGECGAD